MSVDDLTIFDSWDIYQPDIPTRSHLFPIEPIGVKTPYVESLTSYLARLAQSHTLSVNDLVARKVKSVIPKI